MVAAVENYIKSAGRTPDQLPPDQNEHGRTPHPRRGRIARTALALIAAASLVPLAADSLLTLSRVKSPTHVITSGNTSDFWEQMKQYHLAHPGNEFADPFGPDGVSAWQKFLGIQGSDQTHPSHRIPRRGR